MDKMGNLSSCIGIRGRNREDDYKYLELRPPALIDGYETLSHMYYTHARMAILHLNNDTGHFLKHKVVRVITLQRCPSPHSQCFVACFLGYSTGWRVDTVATFCPSKPSGTHEGKHNNGIHKSTLCVIRSFLKFLFMFSSKFLSQFFLSLAAQQL